MEVAKSKRINSWEEEKQSQQISTARYPRSETTTNTSSRRRPYCILFRYSGKSKRRFANWYWPDFV